MNQFFTSIVTVYKKYGTIYVDDTGNFLTTIIDRYIAIFSLYNCTKHEILATPIKDTKDETLIDAFQTHIKYITKRGFKPCFNVVDNVASKAIKVHLQEENIHMQLVKPHNHQVNALESEIQTFKNHFISGMSIRDEKFPIILWSGSSSR